MRQQKNPPSSRIVELFVIPVAGYSGSNMRFIFVYFSCCRKEEKIFNI